MTARLRMSPESSTGAEQAFEIDKGEVLDNSESRGHKMRVDRREGAVVHHGLSAFPSDRILPSVVAATQPEGQAVCEPSFGVGTHCAGPRTTVNGCMIATSMDLLDTFRWYAPHEQLLSSLITDRTLEPQITQEVKNRCLHLRPWTVAH